MSGKHWNDKKKKHRFKFTFGLDKYEEGVENRGI